MDGEKFKETEYYKNLSDSEKFQFEFYFVNPENEGWSLDKIDGCLNHFESLNSVSYHMEQAYNQKIIVREFKEGKLGGYKLSQKTIENLEKIISSEGKN